MYFFAQRVSRLIYPARDLQIYESFQKECLELSDFPQNTTLPPPAARNETLECKEALITNQRQNF